MAAIAAGSGLRPLAVCAVASMNLEPRRWRLLSIGIGCHSVVEKLQKQHPDIVSKRVAVISGMAELPFGQPGVDVISPYCRYFRRRATSCSVSAEVQPLLVIAPLGGFVGSQYFHDYIRFLRTSEEAHMRIHGVVFRPFNFENCFKRSFGIERQLRRLFDTLTVLENRPLQGDNMDALDCAERDAIYQITRYLSV